VVVNYRGNEAAAQEVVAAIRAAGGEAIAVQGDVRLAAEANALVQKALDAYGRLDILVNNAGTTRDTLLLRMSDEDWDLVLETNLKGVFHCTKAALRPMLRQRYGRIISVSSVSGLAGNAGQANYAAAKGGIVAFTRSVAREVGSRSITVNAIAPGFIKTDMTTDFVNNPEVAGKVLDAVPLKRFGEATEIAAMVAFLCSEEAGYITGQVFAVDGGMAM